MITEKGNANSDRGMEHEKKTQIFVGLFLYGDDLRDGGDSAVYDSR